jgi:hypothetical protein
MRGGSLQCGGGCVNIVGVRVVRTGNVWSGGEFGVVLELQRGHVLGCVWRGVLLALSVGNEYVWSDGSGVVRGGSDGVSDICADNGCSIEFSDDFGTDT